MAALTPHDIAQLLRDIGRISNGEAHTLEQRIVAWGQSQKAIGHHEGIVEAVSRAKTAVLGIKSAAQRAAAEKPLRAVQKLLPGHTEDYQRGYRDGTTDERRKSASAQPKH